MFKKDSFSKPFSCIPKKSKTIKDIPDIEQKKVPNDSNILIEILSILFRLYFEFRF